MAIEFHYQKRIDNSAVVRRVDARQRQQWFLLTTLATVFVFSLIFYGWQYYRGIKIGYDRENAQKARQALIEMNQQYRAVLEAQSALDRVVAAATAMGMVPRVHGQTVVFHPSPADLLDRPALALATKE